jgi:hypothetical protein
MRRELGHKRHKRLTLKAFTNFSPAVGAERQPWDIEEHNNNPERVRQMSSIPASEVEFLGFALGDCTLDLEPGSAKYLRVVHGTALELAVHNQFGAEFGGFWLLSPQITQLRRLPEYYSPDEAPLVEFAIEAYLAAQIREFKF